MGLPVPVIPLELPSYQRKENFGADETFFQIVRHFAQPLPRTPEVTANLLGPTALGFRHRDDIEEITRLLADMGIGVNVVAPMGASPAGGSATQFRIRVSASSRASGQSSRRVSTSTGPGVPTGALDPRRHARHRFAPVGRPATRRR